MINLPQHLLHDAWFVKTSLTPILVTAVHAGRAVPKALIPYLNPQHDLARREEDPLTEYFAQTPYNVFATTWSRFAGDLNRTRAKALDTSLESTWGIPIWHSQPPAYLIEQLLQEHDRFYQLMQYWLEQLIKVFHSVLVIDIHSYNHQRDGIGQPADARQNPDIDLGMTTLDKDRFGQLAYTLKDRLQFNTQRALQNSGINYQLDVRENVRYPDGGHWPEWVYKNYADKICTVTLEYKKFYMDEWSNHADLNKVEACRVGLQQTLKAIDYLI